jgi:F-type H+-transporting ATPase subunit b
LFVWQVLIFVGLIFLLKICLETNSDAVNDREEGIKTHYFLLKMQERNANLQADNQRILQEARWNVITC